MPRTLTLLLLSLAVAVGPASSAQRTKCRLSYDLEGWSAFYKVANGSGRITCSNGQAADVTIETRGGGISFGTTKVIGGKGVFSQVNDIRDLYGSYGEAVAHAGAGESAAARFMVKGNVNLSLHGTGQGISVGIAFGSFKIKPR